MSFARNPWPGRAMALLATLGALWAVMVVHATGQTLLALTLLAISALAVWTYTSQRTNALRYLFPGIAAAMVFVIFPMLYTMGIAFTNQSSQNLLDLERARSQLMEEAVVAPGSQRAFTLEAQGDKLRLRLKGAPADPGGIDSVTPPIALPAEAPLPQTIALQADGAAATALPLAEVVQRLPALRLLKLQQGDGTLLTLISLREFAQVLPLYVAQPDGALADRLSGKVYRADMAEGFFTAEDGDRLQPGFRVGVGLRHFRQVFSEGKFREPFLSVFVWTVVFSGLTVIGTAALGMLLAGLLDWQALPGRGAYRLVLFLPYAVPGFISILVFKGLFNQNLGEVNLILNALFGIRPAWFSDPLLAKAMLLIVNIWLGFPYMMVLCSGLIQSIPADLYEASAVVGAGPWTNFRRITLPLILKPLTPLLISAFAFNFNNFVLVSLLTGGRPDLADSTLPAGTTDILVSYTWRIAFQDTGQQFGLAAAISTVIFLIVAAITLIQLRFTAPAEASRKH
jgi:maltose/maltodextrin transport system permease protein